MKTLVLGLGNTILSDDGVGPRVAEEIGGRIVNEEVTILETCVAGLGLLDVLAGYDRAIIVDAIQTVGGAAGQVYRLDPHDLGSAMHVTSPHDVDFTTAMELGRRLGVALPGEVVIFAVEARDVTTFSEECTPDVRRAIPLCADMVIEELSKAPVNI